MDSSGDNAWGLLYHHDVANPAWGSIPGYSLRTVHWRNALVDGDGGEKCPCATTVYRCLYFVISMESILRSRIFQQQGVRFSKLLRIALAYEDRIWTHAGSSEEYGRIMSSLETFTRDTWNTFNLEEQQQQQQQQLHILQHCDTNLHLLHEACDLSKSGNFPSFHELLAWWPLLPQPYRKLLEPWWTLQQFPASSSAAASCYSSFLPLSRPRPSQPGAAAPAGASSRPAPELIVLLVPTSTPLNLTPMIDLQAPNHVQQQLPLYPHNHVALRVQPIQNQELHLFSKMTTSHQQQQQQHHQHHQEQQQQQQEQQHHHHQQHQLPCTDAPPASCHHQNPSTGTSSSSPCPSCSSSDWHHQSRQNCSGLIFSSLQQQQFNQNSSGLISSSSSSSSSSGYCSYSSCSAPLQQQFRQDFSGIIPSSSSSSSLGYCSYSSCSAPLQQQFRQDFSGIIPSSSSSSSSSSMAFEQQGQQLGQRTLEGSLMDCDILACEIYMSLRHLVENGGGDDGIHPALPGPSLSLLRWGMITEGRVIDTMQYLLHQQQTN